MHALLESIDLHNEREEALADDYTHGLIDAAEYLDVLEDTFGAIGCTQQRSHKEAKRRVRAALYGQEG